MDRSAGIHTGGVKVFYRPIEASIRWSNLTHHEPYILRVMGQRNWPVEADFPLWPHLRLNSERILDGIRNGDLPFGSNGITTNDRADIDSPSLSVRHVDLKRWMYSVYPSERPRFLFDDIERQAHPAIHLNTVQSLMLDRKLLRQRFRHQGKTLDSLQTKYRDLLREVDAVKSNGNGPNAALSTRGESTYLHIIAGLLTLLLGSSPAGRAYSSFRSQESVINAMLAQHGNVLGISRSTLENKFAEAKRRINSL
ncbi:hypothetical protein [Chitinimonas koreensis]|uniref:hypothetical protein n=1 Tax=Chitinimonas koreensis TaxID=356302 RepID=UPI00055269C0|nr:hypothetical protein [Chitinimonas koreensis]QNM96763.1 hypothetical protein H9L41_23975 [Chitinimonas koreensis]